MKPAIAAALFLATAIAVDAGAFHSFDQHAVSHWMPWFRPRRHHLFTLGALFVPGTDGSAAKRLLNIWIYPAAFAPSGVVVGWVAWRSRRLWWPLAWLAGNAVELAGKLIVDRPALYWHGRRITSFDHSLPSGHTIRALLVAAALAWTWRRGRWAYAWAATVPVVLVLLGHHVPMDCVAGVCVAAAAISLARRGTA